jgi:hypothetical protein
LTVEVATSTVKPFTDAAAGGCVRLVLVRLKILTGYRGCLGVTDEMQVA